MAIDKVLTERRIIQLKERPLNISEFLAPLSSSYFTSSDIYTKMIVRLFKILKFNKYYI